MCEKRRLCQTRNTFQPAALPADFRHIRPASPLQFSADKKIQIVLKGLHGEVTCGGLRAERGGCPGRPAVPIHSPALRRPGSAPRWLALIGSMICDGQRRTAGGLCAICKQYGPGRITSSNFPEACAGRTIHSAHRAVVPSDFLAFAFAGPGGPDRGSGQVGRVCPAIDSCGSGCRRAGDRPAGA
jgi:hypothetical protein